MLVRLEHACDNDNWDTWFSMFWYTGVSLQDAARADLPDRRREKGGDWHSTSLEEDQEDLTTPHTHTHIHIHTYGSLASPPHMWDLRTNTHAGDQTGCVVAKKGYNANKH